MQRNLKFLAALCCGVCGSLWSASAQAQASVYPAKPIRFIVGFPPSGTNDFLARAVAPKMGEFLGQQVVVDNRGGASTMIATELVSRAPPDGYTILLNAPAHSTNPTLAKPNYDSVRDFAFISLVAESQNLLVLHTSIPTKTVKEFLAFARARQGEINYGSSGAGMVALLSGEISMYFANIPVAIQHVRNGRLRPVALSGTRRNPAVPGIPTLSESGLVGFDVTSWFGIAAPAKTPRAIVDQLNGAIVRAVNTPDLRARFLDQGAEPVGNSPEQYTAFIEREIAKWAKVIKAAGIKAQ
jgi:tripartite-type tricarboxylate transporter receptor subunit TctC